MWLFGYFVSPAEMPVVDALISLKWSGKLKSRTKANICSSGVISLMTRIVPEEGHIRALQSASLTESK